MSLTITTAYLSLGSNLGDRIANLQSCIARLGSIGQVKKISSFYETEPLELRDQPWFVNCVVELLTELRPEELLAVIELIEAGVSRKDIVLGFDPPELRSHTEFAVA